MNDWITESRNPASRGLDNKPVEEILHIINAEDKKVPEAVGQAIDQIAVAVEAFVTSYRRGGRIFYVGAGTSGRLGVVDAVECPPTFGVPPERIQGILAGGMNAFFKAEESYEDDRDGGRRLIEERTMSEKDLIVGISASGETPFVLGLIEAAKQRSIKTVGITNNPQSTLARLVEIPIVVVVGPEVIAGSTRMKAGTAQKLVLNMLSTTAMVKLGKVYDHFMIDLQASNSKLRRRAEEMVRTLTGEDPKLVKQTLTQANYAVKPALIMLKGKVSYEKAKKLLERHHGVVREALKDLGIKED
ncbi:N-acetylmuramic acid 6-phosphate etherase [Candidatus Acetothermia bacterium]|nr:MAG: N-acetylmuramic acid 6-phosphate etherase [Candidatus Acetothermia bacterium]